MDRKTTGTRSDPGGKAPHRSCPRPLRMLATATAVAVATLALAGDSAGGPGVRSDPQPRTASCTFTNPAYAGECVETTEIPEESNAEKACTVILECLNNPRCVTVYCKASTLRSGWVLKNAEAL